MERAPRKVPEEGKVCRVFAKACLLKGGGERRARSALGVIFVIRAVQVRLRHGGDNVQVEAVGVGMILA